MYFRKKTSSGRSYLQIVESRREGEKIRSNSFGSTCRGLRSRTNIKLSQ